MRLTRSESDEENDLLNRHRAVVFLLYLIVGSSYPPPEIGSNSMLRWNVTAVVFMFTRAFTWLTKVSYEDERGIAQANAQKDTAAVDNIHMYDNNSIYFTFSKVR